MNLKAFRKYKFVVIDFIMATPLELTGLVRNFLIKTEELESYLRIYRVLDIRIYRK